MKKYFDRWKEYPNFQAEGAYTTLHAPKQTIEKANKLMGGWPDDEAIISQLEGASISGPAGYLYIRPDNHQGYKDAVTGFSMNSPDYRSRSSTRTESSRFPSATSRRLRAGRRRAATTLARTPGSTRPGPQVKV